MHIRHTVMHSPVDQLLLVARDDTLIGLYFENHAHAASRGNIGQAVRAKDDAFLQKVVYELREYFNGEREEFSVATSTAGDEFSEAVWQKLTHIPYGRTVTYGSIATELGDVRLSQRVGQTVGRNPVSIIIPCHRVIGADGTLTGFGGGLERKRILLELEEPEEVRNSRLF